MSRRFLPSSSTSIEGQGPSVRLYVPPSGLSPLYIFNRVTSDLDLLHVGVMTTARLELKVKVIQEVDVPAISTVELNWTEGQGPSVLRLSARFSAVSFPLYLSNRVISDLDLLYVWVMTTARLELRSRS